MDLSRISQALPYTAHLIEKAPLSAHDHWILNSCKTTAFVVFLFAALPLSFACDFSYWVKRAILWIAGKSPQETKGSASPAQPSPSLKTTHKTLLLPVFGLLTLFCYRSIQKAPFPMPIIAPSKPLWPIASAALALALSILGITMACHSEQSASDSNSDETRQYNLENLSKIKKFLRWNPRLALNIRQRTLHLFRSRSFT